jgi:hypothetical protein
MTGERFTALVLNKTIAVSGTTLKIILQPVKGTRAIINAIEVFEIIPAEKKTLPQEGYCLKTHFPVVSLSIKLHSLEDGLTMETI